MDIKGDFVHLDSIDRMSIRLFNHIKNISACIIGQNTAGGPAEVLPRKGQYFVSPYADLDTWGSKLPQWTMDELHFPQTWELQLGFRSFYLDA